MKLKKKKGYISFLCIQCTILMKNNDLGMGRKSRKKEGASGGKAVSGLAPLKEPLSVEQGRRTILASAWCRRGMVMAKDPVDQMGGAGGQ